MPDSAQRAEQIADLQQRVHSAGGLVTLLESVCRLHAALEEGVVHKIEIGSSQVGCVTFDGPVHVGHELLARRVRDAIRFIRQGHAITTAGDDGAINVWKDDDGMWRCEFMRRQNTLQASSFKSIAAVAAWLQEWWPAMKRGRAG